MGIRSKLMVLILGVLVIAIAGILWRSTEIFFQDKSDFVKQLTNKLSSGTTFQVSDRLRLLRDKLALFVSTRESLKTVSGKNSQYKSVLFDQFVEFQSVSILTLRPSGWQIEWTELRPSLFWPDGTDSFLLKEMNPSTIDKNSIYVHSAQTPEGAPLFVLSFRAELEETGKSTSTEKIFAGVMNPDAFSDIVMGYKGDLNLVFVVNSAGKVIAHPEEKFTGTEFISHPIVEEISQKSRKSGVGNFLDENKQEVIGSFSDVSGTNLFVVSTTPTLEAFKAANDLRTIVVIFGFGTLLVGLGLAVFFATKITRPLDELAIAAAEIGAGNFSKEVKVTTNDEVGRLAESINKMRTSLKERDELLDNQKQALIQSEKMGAFGQLSAGIAHEVKNPLAGILGHAQLAKGKAVSDDVKKHLEVIEKETRRTKEIIENLMKFARAEKADLIPTNLTETVAATVDLVDHQLGLMGVRIHKKLVQVPQVSANANQLQQVFLNIMMNAGHAMEKSEKKELTVSTEHVGDIVRVKIADTGSGIPKEIQTKIFEPFFTTKPAGKGTGLGLSVSFGIIRDHKGKIYVESTMGKGTTFFIDLPMAGKALAGQKTEAPVENKEPAPLKVSAPKIKEDRKEPPSVSSIGAPPIPTAKTPPPTMDTPKQVSKPAPPPAPNSNEMAYNGAPKAPTAPPAPSAPAAPSVKLDASKLASGVGLPPAPKDEEALYNPNVSASVAAQKSGPPPFVNPVHAPSAKADGARAAATPNTSSVPAPQMPPSPKRDEIYDGGEKKSAADKFQVKIRTPKLKV